MDITVQGLTKVYGGKAAVDDVSFTVREGHVTGFLGPNGAGKSTTMRMILGLDRPDAGVVRYGDRALTRYGNPLQVVGSLLDARATDPRMSPLKHLSALGATHGVPRQRVDEVIDMTGLATVAAKRSGGFSLGMSQRLGMATAMLADPEVLVLDEPINGLDPDGVRWMRDLLRSYATSGRTVLISSHLMNEMAQTADRVLVIGRGRLIADAPTAEVVAGASATTTRVRSPQISALIAALPTDDGVRARSVDADTSVVTGFGPEQIGRLAARQGIVLFELAPIQSSLEDAYLELTADAVDYTAGAIA